MNGVSEGGRGAARGADEQETARPPGTARLPGVPAQHGAADPEPTAAVPDPPLPLPGSPRQLPPPPAHFVSRSDELSDLDALTGSGSGSRAQVVVVVGPGGVGKTALAVTWASGHAHRYPDGQLYTDLRGFSADTAVAPEEVLGVFLRALGVAPERVPAGLAEQVGLYRTVTAGRRLLVVLDNAVSTAQVRSLIPASAGCAVVVTSRLRLDGLLADGARFVDVAPLPREDAIALLTRTVGPDRADVEPAEVAELAELCGRFPITLRVAAARLAARPRWPVSRVVARLRDERSRLATLSRLAGAEDSATAAFDWSYRELPEHAALLYRLAAEVPGPEFTAGLAAAVTGLRDDVVRDALELLVDASLLEEADLDRYRFHDLVRLHARAQRDEARFEAVPRAARWYLRELTRANLVVIPARWRVSPVADEVRAEPAPFADDGAALDWLAGQLPNVLPLLEEAVADRHDEIAWQLCEALWELLLYRKHYPEWLRSHELGITAAQRCHDRVAESRLRYQLGRACFDLGQLEPAERETRWAAELAREAHDRRNESAALEQLGMVAQARGDFDAAVVLFADSLRIEEELGIERGVAARHWRIGEALLRAGRETAAARHLEAAAQVFTEIGDDKGAARAAIGLARIDARSGRPDGAIRRLEHARGVLGRLGSAVHEANVLLALAEVAEADDQRGRARAYLAEAVELLADVGGAALERARAALEAADRGEGT
ncbi:tetratricopeptide repeat protein [Amycolatopsis sp. OK19-0408]|uniref:Tetratricopeptide repeat protein n=1 Tax=Amycolatopsis iheyensis TaxID=2945988 RepID=A0A9X2ND81_9PSEU|nr:tetratricopeptide repeat protein [Amycolatopsis iheyensis]MCR6485637.1 tetratricopeptide repeat protein [Amycolatopsis iheyensis]